MSKEVLISSEGEFFRLGERSIPKCNARSLCLDNRAIVSDERTIDLSVSSSEPYERWWYYEILEHKDGAVNLERMNDSAMTLYNHNRNDYLGVIEKAWLDGEKLYNTIRFDTHELAERIVKSINNGIVKNVSIGYMIDELVLYKESKDDLNTYKATKWTPFESSFVTVPADATVGVGRQYFNLNVPPQSPNRENSSIEETIKEETTIVVDTPVIDIEKERKAERDRTSSILAGGSKWNCPELAQKAVEENWSVQQFHSEVLKRQGTEQEPIAKPNDPLGMSSSEKRRYRLSNAIEAAMNKGRWVKNCLEKEVHEALVSQAKANGNYKETNNIKIPALDINVDRSSASQYRNQQVGNPLLGGNLVETELAEQSFIELFRNASIMRRMGMRSLTGLVGNLDIPRHTAGVTDGNSIYWVAEDTDVSQIESEFGLVQFRPKIAGSYMYVTRSMLVQSSIPMDNFMREQLAIALALGMDRAAIEGTGTNEEPLGILNTPGVNPIIFGANGDVPTWEKLVQFETKVAVANADQRTMGWVMNPKLRGELKSRQKFAGTTGETLWQNANATSNDGYVNGYMAGVSNQVPGNLTKGTGTNLSATVFGDYSRLVCAEWGSLELAADPYDRFLSGGVRVRIIHMCDIQVTQEKAFSVATDINTPFSDAA